MAPIHHHFEKLGWSESQIVIRFWIIAVILAALGMATLKLGRMLNLTKRNKKVVLGLGKTGLSVVNTRASRCLVDLLG